MEIIIYPDEIDEYGNPLGFLAELSNPPRNFPKSATLFSAETGWEALAEMAEKFKKMGFLV